MTEQYRWRTSRYQRYGACRFTGLHFDTPQSFALGIMFHQGRLQNELCGKVANGNAGGDQPKTARFHGDENWDLVQFE